MKLSVSSDELQFHYATIVKKEFNIGELEKYLIKKFYLNSNKNEKIKNNVNDNLRLLFFECDEGRIIQDEERIKCDKSEKIFKVFTKLDLLNKNTENIKAKNYSLKITPSIFKSSSKIKSLTIEELIMKVTGAKKKIKIQNTKQYLYTPTESPNLSLDKIITTINMIMSNFSNSISQSDNIDFLNNYSNYFSNVTPDDRYIQALTEMGVSEERARLALILSKNNVLLASELIFTPNFESIFTVLTSQRPVSIYLIFLNYRAPILGLMGICFMVVMAWLVILCKMIYRSCYTIDYN